MKDWRPTRDALDLAYIAMGETHLNIPERDWNLATALRDAFVKQSEFTCAGCQRPIRYREEIRCLDCGAALHKECAPRHFWPNGRPEAA